MNKTKKIGKNIKKYVQKRIIYSIIQKYKK